MKPFRRIGPYSSTLQLLAFPPPYRAWLSVSNDPDQTNLEAWLELDEIIWKKLKLPFGDSFFLYSFNEHIPDQVSMATHPNLASRHQYDTMHTWGDFVNSRSHCFTRQDACNGLRMMQRLGLKPKIWTDHDVFVGNLLHNSTRGSRPTIRDACGYEEQVFEYTLDLAYQAGVRYIWDGALSSFLGHDREISRKEWYYNHSSVFWKAQVTAAADRMARPLWNYLQAARFSYNPDTSKQYFPQIFPDNRKLYCFRRYGRWELADIDGFGQLIRPSELDKLAMVQGTCIVYTHLGKRPFARRNDTSHILPATLKSLQNLQNAYVENRIIVSSTSRLLDYLVLRDHAKLSNQTIDFSPDGVRFEQLTAGDLEGFEFGFFSSRGREPDVSIEGNPVAFKVTDVGHGYGKLSFGTREEL
jgi:hypothetical protein